MKKLVLVIGPEATGTRVLTGILSQHPKILGTSNASSHHDCLDSVWRELELGTLDKAIKVFPDCKNFECILTRRSMPHSLEVGKPAKFMKFAKLKELHKLCRNINLELLLLVTSRSTIPHLIAWTLTRSSTQKSFDKAKLQYRRAYIYLFDFIKRYKVPFYFVSLESLLLDGQEYVQSLFQLLDLPSYEVNFNLDKDVNLKRYNWYSKQKI